MIVNGRNYFNDNSFNEICKLLERGERVEVYIDCIGHTRNNYEQEVYKRELTEKYRDKLNIEEVPGACSYHYEYSLKEVK